MFAVSVIVYWALAFVIGSAIPQFSNISSLIAAVCIFRESCFGRLFFVGVDLLHCSGESEFSYTFPPFMILGYVMQRSALAGDRPYDVKNPHGSRVDSWRDLSRWARACMSMILSSVVLLADHLFYCLVSKHVWFNLWNFIITLACVATAVLASYSAIKSIIDAFRSSSSATSFGCRSPVQ